MAIGTSSGKVYENEFDMIFDGMGKLDEMPNYQPAGKTPDNLIPETPKIKIEGIDREPPGPMPVPGSKDAEVVPLNMLPPAANDNKQNMDDARKQFNLPDTKIKQFRRPFDKLGSIEQQATLIDRAKAWLGIGNVLTPEDFGTKRIQQDPASKSWPGEEDLKISERYNRMYGDPSAKYVDPRFSNMQVVTPAAVVAWSERKEGFEPKIRPMKQADADVIHEQWIAAERSPISKLGFNPGKIFQTPAESKTEVGNLAGIYKPASDEIWYDARFKATPIHEALHRGFEILAKAGIRNTTEYSEEVLVRALMMRHFGNIEVEADERIRQGKYDPNSAGGRQVERAKQVPSSVLDDIEKRAGEYLTTKRGKRSASLTDETPDSVQVGQQYAGDFSKSPYNPLSGFSMVLPDPNAIAGGASGAAFIAKNNKPSPWHPENTAKLKELNDKGLSSSEIAKELGVSKGSVIGKMDREGIESKSGRSFGGNTFEGAGGNPTKPSGMSDMERTGFELEKHLTTYAQGKMTATEVQKKFKDAGWSVNLRGKASEIEAFDPTGKAHYLVP